METKILYLQFFKDEEPMKNQLWKLQHPGNKTVDSWNESMILRKGEEVSVRTSIRTKNFLITVCLALKILSRILKSIWPRNMEKTNSKKLNKTIYNLVYTECGRKCRCDFLTGTYGMMFPSLIQNPSPEEIKTAIRKRIDDRALYYRPFLFGMATFSEEYIGNATPFELLVIDELRVLREEILERRIYKTILMEPRS